MTDDDVSRIVATERQVWFTDRPGVSPADQLASLDLDRVRAVEQPVASGVAGPEPFAGVYGSWVMGLTVPGDDGGARVIDADGLTWVGVHPDHRRQGVLRLMMRDHLGRIGDEGRCAVAVLHASEPGICGRFGYATASMDLTLHLGRGTELRARAAVVEAAEAVTTRLLSAADAAAQLHDAHRLTGAVSVLAAAYLGGRSISSQAAAGLVTEHRAGAVTTLSRAMRGDREPYGAPIF